MNWTRKGAVTTPSKEKTKKKSAKKTCNHRKKGKK